MSYSFPESPILLYPSLAKRLGVEAAVLLTLYHKRFERVAGFGSDEQPELIFSKEQWLSLGQFWDEEQLAQLTNLLVGEGMIDAAFASDGRVRIIMLAPDSEGDDLPVADADVEIVARLPVVEVLPERVVPPSDVLNHTAPEVQDTPYYPDPPVSQPQSTYNSNPGPAPTFGGSIGWAKKNRQGDELQALFQQHEKRNKQLHAMELGWQPSENFFALLPRHNIAPQFAISCLDEFVLYWLDKDRKETNWDQKFLGWVKREWVKKQTQDGRQQRINNEQKAGFNHENPRRDTREKRKRVTAAIMDIKDTDW